MIGHPGILLLDEPFSALDPFTRATQHRVVLDLWRELRPTILMVTHDVDEAVFLADRIVIMQPRPGRVRETMTVDPPRPRDRDHLAPAFDLMKRRVMRAIDRSLAEERPRQASAASNLSPWVEAEPRYAHLVMYVAGDRCTSPGVASHGSPVPGQFANF